MSKFKAGDVVISNCNMILYETAKIIPKGSIKSITNTWRDKVMIDGGNFGEYPEHFFDLYVQDNKIPNGVDAEGNPKYFDENMLEDFMIVKLRDGNEGIISNQKHLQHKPPYVIYYHAGKGFDLARFQDGEEYYTDIVEVFETKPHNCLKGSNAAGVKLIWKAQPKETANQKEIRELEESIKEATKKLEALKSK